MTFTETGTITTLAANPRSAVIDNTSSFAYFANSTSPGVITKIDLATFTETGTITILASNPYSAVIDNANLFAYFGSYTSPGKITKINITTGVVIKKAILDTSSKYW
jgi:hypothetical protein